MTGDPLNPHSALDPSDEWADAKGAEAPVSRRSSAEDARIAIQPRAVVSARRREIEKAASETEGLRIGPRLLAEPIDRPESTETRPKIQVQEHGKQVVRLESEVTAPFVERTEALPRLQPLGAKPVNREAKFSAEWGKTVKHSYKWLGWAAGAVALLLVLGLVGQSLLQNKEATSRSDPFNALQVVEDVVKTEDPTVFFEQNPVQVVEEIHQAMGVYARARTLEEALPVIRHGEKLKPLLSKSWKSWEVPEDWAISDSDVIGYDSVGKVPYAIISGTLPDFSRYQVFLVHEGDRMLVDWEASMARSNHTVEELNDPGLAGAEVRVEASPVSFYTLAYPEDHYRAFRLVLGSSENFIWGYVEKGSPAALAMEDIFMENQQFSDKPTTGKVRLRLTRGETGALANQWLILDVLHKGWVTP